MKEYERSQQKVLEDMMKKRQTKVDAYRKSRMTGLMGLQKKNQFENISFLKDLK